MKRKKLIAIALVSAMLLSIAGCGKKTESASAGPAAAQDAQSQDAGSAGDTASEPEENPILKYEGAYSDENGGGIYMLFEAEDETDGVRISVGYPEETTYTYWEFIGKIKDNVITYENGYKFSQERGTGDQEEVTEKEIYNDGSGTIEISEDARITWKDNKEDIANGMVFVWDEEMNTMIAEQKEGAGSYYDDTQNPAMNWAGPYTDTNSKGRTMLLYSGSEDGTDCLVTITDTPSPDKMTDWMMTGELDTETLTITYTSCTKTEYELDADGNIVSENKIYEDGTGSFVIDEEDQTLTWIDDKEDAGKGSLFVFSYDYGDFGGEAWTGEPAAEAP